MKATHWIIAAALLPGSSFCQYSGLAVTRDGSRVYFASTLRQRGTDQFLHSKIFLLDDAGVTLAAQRERIGVSLTNPYILTAPQISGDGAVVAYANTLTCQGGSSCFLRERTGGTVTFAGGRPDFSFGGVFRLSRNGRYLARCSSSGVMAATASLEDLAGGTSTDLLEDLGRFTPLAVSSRGAVLLTVPSTGVVLFQDKKKHILARDETYAADIDDAGTTVVFQNTRAQLVVVDVAGGRQWTLGAPDRANIRPSLSDDGQYVLYLSRIGAADQILFSRIDGSEWRQLTALEEGISEARLSGDGKIAYAIAGNGAILRIDTGSGVVRTLVGRTPRIDGIIGGAAPGSANILYGAHLAPETATAASPLPEQLRGVTVRIGEQPALLQMVSPERILYQIPWETPVPEPLRYVDTAVVLSGGDPYFDVAFPVSLGSVHAASAGGLLQAIHASNSTPITPDNPAYPGEVVYLYATGLGPVEPAVPSGQPPPSGQLSKLILPWEFLLDVAREPQRPAEVLFAGLAPALIGFYQINIKLPDTLPGESVGLTAKFTKDYWVSWRLAFIPLSH